MTSVTVILFEITFDKLHFPLNRSFCKRPENINVKQRSSLCTAAPLFKNFFRRGAAVHRLVKISTKHAINSPVMFVTHMCFAVLLCKLTNTCLKHVRQRKSHELIITSIQTDTTRKEVVQFTSCTFFIYLPTLVSFAFFSFLQKVRQNNVNYNYCCKTVFNINSGAIFFVVL